MIDRVHALIQLGVDPTCGYVGEVPLSIAEARAKDSKCPDSKAFSAITELLRKAMMPWSPSLHQVLPRRHRARVCTILTVALRLHARINFPRLPPELWYLIIGHIKIHDGDPIEASKKLEIGYRAESTHAQRAAWRIERLHHRHGDAVEPLKFLEQHANGQADIDLVTDDESEDDSDGEMMDSGKVQSSQQHSCRIRLFQEEVVES